MISFYGKFGAHVSLQMDIDIGSSSVAKGVVNLVANYASKLVLEMAFLIQVFLILFPFPIVEEK